MNFPNEVKRLNGQPVIHTFGKSSEERNLPLAVLSNGAPTPDVARKMRRPVVLVLANIHAGEVEGKEAAQQLIREVAGGSLKPLLDKIVLLVVPIYNADGNEKIDPRNRTHQNGPPEGVGTRENGQRLDLNRDFMKMEAPETQGLIENVLVKWDPQVVIDLHTTDGSYHGYALTYAPPLNPNTDPRIIDYLRKRLLPSVTKTLQTEFNYPTYYYGNFAGGPQPSAERPAPPESGEQAWVTFDHRPRFSTNYVGLRNRLAILSEAYVYRGFRTRIDVTYRFVESILKYVAAHSDEVVNLCRSVDMDAQHGRSAEFKNGYGTEFTLKKTPELVEIMVSTVKRVNDPVTGRSHLEAASESHPVKMSEYGEFDAVRRIIRPVAYAFPPELEQVAQLVKRHGIHIERATQPQTLRVEQYRIKEVKQSERQFQGHRETRLTVEREAATITLPAGSYIVPMRQPLAGLAFYLLEPESDDGIVNWNLLDSVAAQARASGNVLPLYRVLR